MKLCEKDKCTGCMACFNICPQHAIQMHPNKEGFLHPHIDELSCVNCGLCTKVCPQLQETVNASKDEKKVFSGWQRSKKILKSSTSGGAFTALASEILKRNGAVYGAGFDEQLRVIHKRIISVAGLAELRGSKYVQCEVGTTFAETKADLRSGRIVLFTGTPCQIEGLYNYLGKRYEGQLYTIDLVCHGVPSPKVYAEYLNYMKGKYKSKPIQVFFRNKKPGWYVFGMKIIFENGQVYENDTYHDPYIRGFLREYFLRPSCHQCKYCNTNRPADITLADDWGFQEKGYFDQDNDQGISMIMLNSQNGINLFESAKRALFVYERTVKEVVNGNPALKSPFPPNKDRQLFWKDFEVGSFEGVVKKYLFSEAIPEWVNERKKNILSDRKLRRKNFFVHIPNRMIIAIIGNKNYENIKRKIKNELRI